MTTRTVYRPANAEGVSERNPAEEVTLALTKPGAHGLPDVVMLSEVSWLDVPALAERHGLHGVQFGERGAPEAGIALVSRRPIHDATLLPGSDAGQGIRARPILLARTGGRTVAAIHAPPERAADLRLQYIATLHAAEAAVIGGDFNLTPAAVRHHFPARTYLGHGVLGVLLRPAAFDALGVAAAVNIRSDHPALDVPVYRSAKSHKGHRR